jgi:negative regulator of sigma E activity
VLEIASGHEGRPSLEIVVDAGSSLLLATEFRDYRGQVAYRSEFRTLLLDPGLPDRPPERKWEGKGRMWDVERVKDTGAKVLPFAMLEPQYLPEGFVRKSSWKSRRSDRVNTMYSDGLTWIQISLSPAEPGSAEKVVTQARCGSRTTMNMVLNGVAVHLVGHLDPAVLLKVLGSLGERPAS